MYIYAYIHWSRVRRICGFVSLMLVVLFSFLYYYSRNEQILYVDVLNKKKHAKECGVYINPRHYYISAYMFVFGWDGQTIRMQCRHECDSDLICILWITNKTCLQGPLPPVSICGDFIIQMVMVVFVRVGVYVQIFSATHVVPDDRAHKMCL